MGPQSLQYRRDHPTPCSQSFSKQVERIGERAAYLEEATLFTLWLGTGMERFALIWPSFLNRSLYGWRTASTL
jgi:hypothetical protein